MVPKFKRFFHLSGSSFELDYPIRLGKQSCIDSVEFMGPPKMNLYPFVFKRCGTPQILYYINLPMHFKINKLIKDGKS